MRQQPRCRCGHEQLYHARGACCVQTSETKRPCGCQSYWPRGFAKPLGDSATSARPKSPSIAAEPTSNARASRRA